MKLRNYWLDRIDERVLLKIIEWAHRHKKMVENLTKEDIDEAVKAYLRDPYHA